MTVFFICSIKSPQCTDKYSKFLFDSDFPSPCFDVPKASNSLPVGYKTTRPRPGDWERLWRHFRTPGLAKNRFEWMCIYILHISHHVSWRFTMLLSEMGRQLVKAPPGSVHIWSHSPTQPMHEMWDETTDIPQHRGLCALLFWTSVREIWWLLQKTGRFCLYPRDS